MIAPWMSHGTAVDYVGQNPLVPKEKLLSEVAAGLAYLHGVQLRHPNGDEVQGVVHGDLKGKNILINDRGEAVISDFGRSKIIADPNYSIVVIGGVPWMAPEVMDSESNGPVPICKESDIWAFGVTMMELFCGVHRLWRGASHTQIVLRVMSKYTKPDHRDYREVPPPIWNIIHRCLEFDATKRPTAGQVSDRFQTLMKPGN